MTPAKHLKIGDTVIVRGYEQHGPRRVAELYDQTIIPGGVKLDEPIDLWSTGGARFRSWNEDELMQPPIVTCSRCDCQYEERHTKVQADGSVICMDCLPDATDPEYIHVTVLRAALDYDPDAEISAEQLLKEIKEMVLKENAR